MAQAQVEDYMVGEAWTRVLKNIVTLNDDALYGILINLLPPLVVGIPIVGPMIRLAWGGTAGYMKYAFGADYSVTVDGIMDPELYPSDEKYMTFMENYRQHFESSKVVDFLQIFEWVYFVPMALYNTILGFVFTFALLIPFVGIIWSTLANL